MWRDRVRAGRPARNGNAGSLNRREPLADDEHCRRAAAHPAVERAPTGQVPRDTCNLVGLAHRAVRARRLSRSAPLLCESFRRRRRADAVDVETR